jgi:hypothetical protein
LRRGGSGKAIFGTLLAFSLSHSHTHTHTHMHTHTQSYFNICIYGHSEYSV